MPGEETPQARLDAFWEATKDVDAAYGMLAKSCGLSEPEYWALVLIRQGVATQREISEQLYLSRQTINSAFKLLVRKGLVRLEVLESDQRSKRAVLTEAGERFVRQTIVPAEELDLQSWQTLTAEEQRTLIRLTAQLGAALRRSLTEKLHQHSSEDL